MSQVRGRVVLIVLGTAAISTVLGGGYRSYVKPSMGPWLLATGAVLVLLAVHGALREFRRYDADHLSAHPEHGHGQVWGLLLAPVACLALLAPPSLGSYTAARAVDAVTARPADVVDDEVPAWPPLPAGDVVALSLGEFITRTQWDGTRALVGRTVRLTGFVVPRAEGEPSAGEWTLARMTIMCCAADAAVYRVQMIDPTGAVGGRPPAADTWLEVEGTWAPTSSGPTGVGPAISDPVLRLVAARAIPAPADPYE